MASHSAPLARHQRRRLHGGSPVQRLSYRPHAFPLSHHLGGVCYGLELGVFLDLRALVRPGVEMVQSPPATTVPARAMIATPGFTHRGNSLRVPLVSGTISGLERLQIIRPCCPASAGAPREARHRARSHGARSWYTWRFGFSREQQAMVPSKCRRENGEPSAGGSLGTRLLRKHPRHGPHAAADCPLSLDVMDRCVEAIDGSRWHRRESSERAERTRTRNHGDETLSHAPLRSTQSWSDDPPTWHEVGALGG